MGLVRIMVISPINVTVALPGISLTKTATTLFLDPGDTISANLTYIEHLKTPQHAFVCRGSGHKN